MDKNELERYRREMMALYGRSTSKGETGDEPEEDEAEAAEAAEAELLPDDTAYAPHSDNEQSGAEEDYNSRYPEPDLSGLYSMTEDDAEPPEYASEESLGDAKGYILVNVRTGDESSAIEGASVTVSATVGGKRMLIASGLTNASGTAKRFEVPVPSPGLSQLPSPDKRPYNLFDVSVAAKGFFNARSVDVPVFAGITSVQNFGMIPVPAFMAENDETVTYYNQEPFLGSPQKEEGK